MARKQRREGSLVRIAGAITAVASAVAAVIALIPHDHAPTAFPTIQNVISLPASGVTTERSASTVASPPHHAGAAAAASARKDETNAAPPSHSSTPPSTNAAADWTGGSAYTAILASQTTEAQARALQHRATARGLDAGVLFSSDFRSLRPGYWVVFSGAYSSADEASTRAQRARALGFADAYPRYVSP